LIDELVEVRKTLASAKRVIVELNGIIMERVKE
jgi:hypothetical protein